MVKWKGEYKMTYPGCGSIKKKPKKSKKKSKK